VTVQPPVSLLLANVTRIKLEEQDDWKKDIHKMSNLYKGLVEAPGKTNEKVLRLEKQIAIEYNPIGGVGWGGSQTPH